MTFDKSSQGYSQGVRKISLMASTVAFEFNKATLKLRRSLHLSPSTSPKFENRRIEGGEDPHDYLVQPSSTKSTSRGGSTKNRQLCAELSSFALYPLFGALSPSHFSTPNLLFQNERKKSNSTRLLQLTDSDLLYIFQQLDPRSLIRLSQTCQRFRRICCGAEKLAPRDSKKIDVTSHELIISFNQLKKQTEVRLLKKDRTRLDPKFVGTSIESMLPMFSRVLSKITFETSVFVSDWMDEILRLYKSNRFIPLCLVFTGGALTKGTSLNGADLRCLTELEFIDFVQKLQPHLQEVQLATSRLFKATPRILSLISVLSSFGIVYERPALRFYVDEVANVIKIWRNDNLARSCDVYMRRPRDGSIDIWQKFGEVAEYREDPQTDEILVSKIHVKHSFLVQIELVLHFH
ncbi:unnamed protein product [Caenorhabditis angaria]|uniref:F-box domain-containing protein n=1 Tax=Caenorhabditis angaria TaxID=860376 RepID=A0A9P1IBS4_9PELO|nr:unnamed protein product [Caenorhabditis angaria]